MFTCCNPTRINAKELKQIFRKKQNLVDCIDLSPEDNLLQENPHQNFMMRRIDTKNLFKSMPEKPKNDEMDIF